MADLPPYPLEQVLEVKKRRRDEAEKVVTAKKKALEIEQVKLQQVEEQRNKVQRHYRDKLDQFRKLLDQETTTDKIQQAKVYIKITEEKLRIEQEKVTRQISEVETAKQNLEQARQLWLQQQKEVDKIAEHRQLWIKQTLSELDLKESNEQDELGNIIHLVNQRKNEGILGETS